MKPTVSVIIPAYNAMNYLPEAIASVQGQTWKDYELLIVNDGSTDNLVNWVAGIQKRDSRLKLLSQTNRGVSAARNLGIAHSQGKYIAFLDADDLWSSTKLEQQVACLDRNLSVGLVDTWIWFADEAGCPLFSGGVDYPVGKVWQRLLTENLIFCGSSPMIRRECFETAGQFDSELFMAEDWHMWVRLAAHYPFQVIKSPLVRYRQARQSVSHRGRESLTKWQNYALAIEKVFQSVPPNLQSLKRQAYSNASLYMAKIAYDDCQYRQSVFFGWQSLSYTPKLLFSLDYWRFSLKAILGSGSVLLHSAPSQS
ncbi:MAG: glycosyltransferase family A protein [Cyanobacteria bacterium J06600_6]